MLPYRRPLVDRTAALLFQGYAWLPDRVRNTAEPLVRVRMAGRHTVALRGPEAVRFFYDERHVRRHGAVPERVRSTLSGHGAVHTLDGEAHRTRKAMFLHLLTDTARIADLVEEVSAAWEEAVAGWTGRDEVVLFDESAVVLTRAVCRWAGVPLADAETEPLARDLVAMVDGFATPGPRHWRARTARVRREEWLGRLVQGVRLGRISVPPGSVLDTVTRHHDSEGRLLDPRTTAVELLNIIRPTVAVSWFVTFAAHAMHRWPDNRKQLWTDDAAFAAAFVHEVRRFYPFAPFSAGRAAADLTWRGRYIPAGSMILLDLYGQNHDEGLWGDPYAFRPKRFLERPVERDELVPQGGGDPATGHRCPGEEITIALLEALSLRLARLEYEVPEQDLRIPLRRIPTRPRSGFRMTRVRVPAEPAPLEPAGPA
ncbi:cytochrome P450 [Streptomyces sp. GC420]|uniref:cytochrome P450 n=1 Tax=Streptomyces sp. GC420 TaxID=2697568 RepID=UPI00141515E5|nr:cytochrome P450 [Streptomyces sp. GC420]NBM20770.1 cytochrome P450 [Streptomyces sp. GC420]